MTSTDMIQKKLAASLPDIPRWVETRAMLLNSQCEIFGLDETSGLVAVVRSDEWELISIIGYPEKRAIIEAIAMGSDEKIILAPPESGEYVSEILPEWTISPASLHLLGEGVRLPSSDEIVRMLTPDELNASTNLPLDLKEELIEASRHSPISSAFADDRPVSFCYAGSQTEGLWDISIDTLEEYRNKGYAAAAVTHLIKYFNRQGKRPIWGAEEANVASMRLAAKLGFVLVDRILVFQE
jgi:RimJ/RimL family protein N-acetyltransferase